MGERPSILHCRARIRRETAEYDLLAVADRSAGFFDFHLLERFVDQLAVRTRSSDRDGRALLHRRCGATPSSRIFGTAKIIAGLGQARPTPAAITMLRETNGRVLPFCRNGWFRRCWRPRSWACRRHYDWLVEGKSSIQHFQAAHS